MHSGKQRLQRIVALIWLLPVGACAAAAPACTYTITASASTGANPRSLATADLNKDGILDLVSGNLDGSSLSVLLGVGNGTFRAAVTYAIGLNPYQVITGDFNGDGNLDLAAADFGGQEVSVLLGNGDGTFGAVVTYATGTKPRGLVAADLNGDGNLDLAVANSTANSTSILLSKGNGTFSEQDRYFVRRYATRNRGRRFQWRRQARPRCCQQLSHRNRDHSARSGHGGIHKRRYGERRLQPIRNCHHGFQRRWPRRPCNS
jgi:hypothetical protein